MTVPAMPARPCLVDEAVFQVIYDAYRAGRPGQRIVNVAVSADLL